MPESELLPLYTIRDLETLKVIADPLRAQLLELLVLEPLTVKEVAGRLGLAPGKLYYHFNLLERHTLIQVVATRIVSGIIEKQYRATAANLTLDDELFAFTTESGKENLNSMITTTIDATRQDILRSLEARYFDLEQGAEPKARRVIFARELNRLSEEQAEAFGARLDALIAEFGAAGDETGQEAGRRQAYALTIAFYPSFYFPHAEEDSETEDQE